MWPLCASTFQLCDLRQLFWPLCASTSGWFHLREVAWTVSWLHCPFSIPRACWNSCTLSQWCYPTYSSSVIILASCNQTFPAFGSFPMSQFFASGGQCIGASAPASVFPVYVQDFFPLGWTGFISLNSKWLSRVFPKPQFKNVISSVLSFLYYPTLHPYMTTGKTIPMTRWTFVSKLMSLLIHMLSR